MQKFLLAIMLLSSYAAGSQTWEISRDKGLVVPLGSNTYCVVQDGKQIILKGQYLGGDIEYNRNYIVQDGYLVMQTSSNLVVVRFDEAGNILAKREIDNRSYGNHSVALYGKTAITTGAIGDRTEQYSRNHELKYVDVETEETTRVDLLKAIRSAGRYDVANVLSLSLVGSKLYVLVYASKLSNTPRDGMLYLSEYNLAADKTNSARMMPIDLATSTDSKDSGTAFNLPVSPTTSDSVKRLSSYRLIRQDRAPETTTWSPVCMEASDKYVVIALNAGTRFFFGESVGYMSSSHAAYLLIDRKTFEPVALYPLSSGADLQSDMYIMRSKLYISSKLYSRLYLFNLDNPTQQKIDKKESESWFNNRSGINAYPIMLEGLVRRGFANVAVAEMNGISSYAHISVANDTVYYIDSYKRDDVLGKAKIEKAGVLK